MSRLVLRTGKQRGFLDEIRVKTGLSFNQLAEELGLSARTLRDWRREKYLMSLEAAERLSTFFNVPIPKVQLYFQSIGVAKKPELLAEKSAYGAMATRGQRRAGE